MDPSRVMLPSLDRPSCTARPYCRISWQKVANEHDRLVAEKKLEGWLVKPTDGIFARMNRKVSIPISRQLIKFPITPNMVSPFYLGRELCVGPVLRH